MPPCAHSISNCATDFAADDANACRARALFFHHRLPIPMADLFKMLETFKQMQGRLQQTQEELARKTFTGSAGGGMVTVECDGKLQLKRVKLERTVVNPDDIEMLEDLIAVASADAQKKAADAMQEEMSKLTGGLELPFKLPF
jgi:DNA-binding YbaB/EbfC family protein